MEDMLGTEGRRKVDAALAKGTAMMQTVDSRVRARVDAVRERGFEGVRDDVRGYVRQHPYRAAIGLGLFLMLLRLLSRGRH